MAWDMEPTTVYNELRLQGKLCDVVISVDGVQFSAHKIILCGCSPYFRSVLETRGDGDKAYFLAWGLLPQCISRAAIGTNALIQHFAIVLAPSWTPELSHNIVPNSSSASGSGV